MKENTLVVFHEVALDAVGGELVRDDQLLGGLVQVVQRGDDQLDGVNCI